MRKKEHRLLFVFNSIPRKKAALLRQPLFLNESPFKLLVCQSASNNDFCALRDLYLTINEQIDFCDKLFMFSCNHPVCIVVRSLKFIL